MRGVAILTEARSGSNWLGSLANRTKRLGRLDEWLDPPFLGSEPEDFAGLIDAVVDRGSTPNGRFAVKIFPRHLMAVQQRYGADFISGIRSRHEVGFVFLRRRDRLRQAISLVRSIQTGKWTSEGTAVREERYAFGEICLACLRLERNYAFWSTYLELFELAHDVLYYEDLIDDPTPYLDLLAKHLHVSLDDRPVSDLTMQRDAVTDEWLSRFREDLSRFGFLPQLQTSGPQRTLRNLWLFLRKKPMNGVRMD